VHMFTYFQKKIKIAQFRYYQSKENRTSATLISTQNSDLTDINFDLELRSNKGIKGKVIDINGDGLQCIFVDIYSTTLDYGDSTTTDDNGVYTFIGLKQANDYIVSAWSDVLGAEYFYFNSTESVVLRNDASAVSPEYPLIDNIDIIITSGRTIRGQVLSDQGPTVSVWVSAWSDTLETGSGALTDENGRYTITGLKETEYIVEIEPQAFPYQAYSLVTAKSYATPVTIFSENIDFYLLSGTNISGNVCDINNTVLSGVTVKAWSPSKGYQNETLSDVSGRYTLLNMKVADDYIVMADAVNYPILYYSNQPDLSDAASVNNTYGNVSNIDFKLDKGPVIRGIVYLEELYGNIQTGIGVNVWSASVNKGGTVITDENGMYEIAGLDQNVDDYIISIWSQSFIPAFYHSQNTVYRHGETEPVAPSDTFRHLILRTGLNVEGTIKTQDQNPIGQFRVEAISDADYKYTEVIENELNSATYIIENLSPGIYTLKIEAENYADQDYQISVDKDLMSADFLLEMPARKISGTIGGLETDEEVDILVKSENVSVNKTATFSGTGKINYEISGLKPSSDYVVTLLTSDNTVIYYNGQTERNLATAVNISDSDAQNINFQLPETTKISGNVYFPTSAQVGETIWIDAIPVDSGTINFTSIRYSGANPVSFEIAGLMKSQYYVTATSSTYKKQYFDSALHKADAEIVDTQTQQHMTGINFHLTKGAYISGQISYPDNTAAENAIIYAMPTQNDAAWGTAVSQSNGSYRVEGLTNSMNYQVYATAPEGNVPFYFNHDTTVTIEASASRIPGNTSGIDIVVQKGKSICGTVRDNTGRGVDNVWVFANSETNGSNSELTDSNGNYCITGLPEGNDYIVSVQSDSGHLPQSQSGISAGASSIDFILIEGFWIKGTVSSAASGQSLSRINLVLKSDETGDVLFKQTDDNGNYQFTGIAEGKYRLICKPDSDNVAYVKSVFDIDIIGNKIFNITLDSALSIQGTVKDKDTQKPVTNAKISVFSNSADLDASTITDSGGSYLISHIPDISDYIITVSAQGYVEIKQQVSAGSQVDFSLEQGGTITGRVEDANGPIRNAFLEISSDLSGDLESAATDANGKYEFSGLKSSWNGMTVTDFKLKVYAQYIDSSGTLCDYPVVVKTGKKVGDQVNFWMISNDIQGSVRDSKGVLFPENSSIQVSVMLFEGNSYMKTIPVSHNGFKVSGLSSGVAYTLYIYPSSTATGFPAIVNAGTFEAGDIVNFHFDSGVW